MADRAVFGLPRYLASTAATSSLRVAMLTRLAIRHPEDAPPWAASSLRQQTQPVTFTMRQCGGQFSMARDSSVESRHGRGFPAAPWQVRDLETLSRVDFFATK